MSWTDERVEQLRSMWNDGKSASQIAKVLGGVTRNAVIGKVHRLGLSNRAAGAVKDEPKAEEVAPPPEVVEVPREPEESAPEIVEEVPDARLAGKDGARRPPGTAPGAGAAAVPAPVSDAAVEALANLAEVERRSRRLHLMDLTERTCKWPIGDPATDEFWFCGLPSMPGKPYCEAHVAVAFQPMSSRRDRRAGGR